MSTKRRKSFECSSISKPLQSSSRYAACILAYIEYWDVRSEYNFIGFRLYGGTGAPRCGKLMRACMHGRVKKKTLTLIDEIEG